MSRSQDTVILKRGADFEAGLLRYLGVRLHSGESEPQLDRAVAIAWDKLLSKYKPPW